MIFLRCAGCGTLVPVGTTGFPAFVCPRSSDGADHVLLPVLKTPSAGGSIQTSSPFLRFSDRMLAFHRCLESGERGIDLYRETVERLSLAVARVSGSTFCQTPLVRSEELSRFFGLSAIPERGGVYLKNETENPGGSHKGRHLFGLMIEFLVGEKLSAHGQDAPSRPPLAIASCGNAALAAAVVARAADWPLQVFIPPDAEKSVVHSLRELGANIHLCEREPHQAGDPCYHRFRQAVAAGALPFCCQGPDNGLTLLGGQTLLAEALCQLAELGKTPSAIVIQVGGGALAASSAIAIETALQTGLLKSWPRFYTAQTESASPLARALHRLRCSFPKETDFSDERIWPTIAANKSKYMWPWESVPRSAAHGILDDETYDWLRIVRAILVSQGDALTVPEDTIVAAHSLTQQCTGISVSATGSAGIAGLCTLHKQEPLAPDETVLCLLTGVSK